MEENKRTELDEMNEKKEIMTPKDYRSIFLEILYNSGIMVF